MSPSECQLLLLLSRLLDYPDVQFFAAICDMRAEIALLAREDQDAPTLFLDSLEQMGSNKAEEAYVATFDHDPAASLYLAWHRYGDDRGQGRAMAALNGLYRAAGFEPEAGTLPDYLPRLLEFLALCDDWAREVALDGFGPELLGLAEHLESSNSAYAPLLRAALAPLKAQWPQFFAARNKIDPTIRPLARHKPECAACTWQDGGA